LPRERVTVAYDGRPFRGWQRQEDGVPSVQQTLEDALFVLTKERTTVHGGGRTDAGVHAERQGAHIELATPIDPRRLADGLNGIMRPAPVAVLDAAEAADDFHARFSAVRRRYRYRILNRRAPPTVEAGFVWHWKRPLDADAMAQAAAIFRGRHDFSAVRSAHCQADSAVKTLDRLDVERRADEVWIHAEARSFLHNQVRIMTGALASVGAGKRDVGGLAAAFASRDRAKMADTAPPDGLTLVEVAY